MSSENSSTETPAVFDPLVSHFPNAYENLPKDIPASQFIAGIKGRLYARQIADIRQRFHIARSRGVPYEKAKRVVDSHKKKLPCVSFAGVLPMRDKTSTPRFTGLFQADLDLLGDRLQEILLILRADPHVYAVFISPTGEGIKAIIRVPICHDGSQYKLVFIAVAKRVRELTGVEIDKLPDFTRLCFASHDPDAYLNPNAVELPVDLTVPAEKPAATKSNISSPTFTSSSIETRRGIAESIVGSVDWESEIVGHLQCPGIALHTNGDNPHDCRIHLDGAPTIHCFHKSCADAVAEANRRLRSEIGRGEKSVTDADHSIRSTPPCGSNVPPASAGQAATPPTTETAGSKARDYKSGSAAETYLGGDESSRPDAAEQPTLIERLAARIYSTANKPDEPAPRFSLGDVPISTPGNITAVSAQAKAGKTAALSAMIASTIAVPKADCLGFSSCNPQAHAVLHLDTEQCPFDLWDGNQRMLRRAGVDAAPPWFHSYALTGFSAPDIRASIRILLQQVAQVCGGVHSVFIDGIADAVCDVNDPAETSSLIAELQGFAIEFDCPIINVIHVNPGSDFKTRGHLGSQLERKSETNLRLEKDGDDVTVIWADKNRRAPIPKITAPRFAWGDSAGMHVSVGSLRDAKDEGEEADLRTTAERVFAATTNKNVTYGRLVEALMVATKESKSTAKRRIEQMLRTQILRKDLPGHYSLVK